MPPLLVVTENVQEGSLPSATKGLLILLPQMCVQIQKNRS